MSPQLRLWDLFSIPCILTVIAASPPTIFPSLESSPSINASTPSTLNTGIEDFTITPTWNGTTLPYSSCITTSMLALTDLALQNSTLNTELETWQNSTDPSLAITLTPPPPNSQIPIRYAIFGIASALKTMLSTPRFESASFALHHRARPVGTVTYSTSLSAPDLSAQSVPFGTTEDVISVNPARRQNSSAPVTYTIPDASGGNGTQLRLEISFTGADMGHTSYLPAIINAMVALSSYPASAHLSQFNFTSPSSNPTTPIHPQSIITFAPANASAPSLTVGQVLLTLGSFPGILLQRAVWREADIDIMAGGAAVGKGRVRRGGVGREGEWGSGAVGVFSGGMAD